MGGLGGLRRVSFLFLPYISRGLMHLVYSWNGLAWLWQTGSLGARKLWFCYYSLYIIDCGLQL